MKDDDFQLLRGFADKRTNEQTFAIVESLSRLKNLASLARCDDPVETLMATAYQNIVSCVHNILVSV